MPQRAMIQQLLRTDQLRPYSTLTEKPAVIGRLFVGVCIGFMMVWSVVVAVLIAWDALASVRMIDISSILYIIVVSLGYLGAFIILTVLAAPVTFLTARGIWRYFVVGHNRLTYPRSVSVGLLIGVGTTLVFTVVLSYIGAIALKIGGWVVIYVIGWGSPSKLRLVVMMASGFIFIAIVSSLSLWLVRTGRTMWVASAGALIIVSTFITGDIIHILSIFYLGTTLILWVFFITIFVTLGTPLVLPLFVCVWLTWRSRRESSADPTAT